MKYAYNEESRPFIRILILGMCRGRPCTEVGRNTGEPER